MNASRLMDYATGDYLRPATTEEMARCRAEIEAGHDEGIILIDARSEWPDYPEAARRCWVDGPLTGGEWLIYRHGSNAANQSMTDRMAVAIVQGTADPEEAKRIAGEQIHCYANQFLSAVAFEDLDDCDEWNDIAIRDAELRDAGEEGIIFDAE